MKVTKPMIQRGIDAYTSSTHAQRMDDGEIVERILRAALNDPKEPPPPIPGQMTVDDYPEAYA